MQLLDWIGEALAGQLALDTESLDDVASQVVRDIIDTAPRHMRDHFGAETSLNDGNGATITTDAIIGITRVDSAAIIRACVRADHLMEDRLDQIDDVLYASDRWPRWFSKNGKIFIKPDPTASSGAGAGLISAVAYPLVDVSADIAIAGFPDGLERSVLLGLVIWVKHKEVSLGRRDAQTEVEGGLATAIALVNTAVDRVNAPVVLANAEFDKVSAILDLANAEFDKISARLDLAEASSQSDVTTALDLINTATDRVNVAVLLANTEFDLMNPEVDTASTSASTNDDLELAAVELGIADRRASTGATYLKEAATAVQEASGYAAEVQSRLGQAAEERAEGDSRSDSGEAFIKEAQARIASGSAYLSEAQASLGEAGGYAAEVQQRFGIVKAYQQNTSLAVEEIKELRQEYEGGLEKYYRNH